MGRGPGAQEPGAHGRDQIPGIPVGWLVSCLPKCPCALGATHVLPSTDEETEAQKGQVTNLRSYSQEAGG